MLPLFILLVKNKIRFCSILLVRIRLYLVGNSFIKSVALLGGGTIIAQIITFLASPLLTRIYDPNAFGDVAVIMAIVGSFLPAVCGKYDVAIVVTRLKKNSIQLLGLSIIITFLFSLFIFFLILYFGNLILPLIGAGNLNNWCRILPVILFCLGALGATNFYLNSIENYSLISRGKILLATLSVFFSLSFGITGNLNGLILSSLIAPTLVCLWLFYKLRSDFCKNIFTFNKTKLILAKRYIKYPLYNASTGLLDGVTLSLPVFFLAKHFPESIVGYYALISKVASAPISFISASVSQINLKKVSKLANQGISIKSYLLKVTIFLFLIILPFSILLVLFSPALFSFVFGQEWIEAGYYLQIIMPSIALKFIVSSLSSTIGGTENNHLGALWKISAFIITFCIYYYFCPKVDVTGMFVTILLTDLFLYILYYLLIWRSAIKPLNLNSKFV